MTIYIITSIYLKGILVDVLSKDDGDGERAFTSVIEPLPCDQREGDLGWGRPSDKG